MSSSSSATTLPQTMKAIQIQQQGGPEVMELREIPVPHPASNQVLIKVEFSG